MSTEEITSLIKNQINEMAKWNVTSVNLDGYDGSGYTYSYSWELLYVMIPDEDSVINAQQKIKDVLNGQTLESSYAENNGNINIPGTGTPQWMYEYGPSQEIVQVEQIQVEPEPIIEEISSSICRNAKLKLFASLLILLITSPLLVCSYA